MRDLPDLTISKAFFTSIYGLPGKDRNAARLAARSPRKDRVMATRRTAARTVVTAITPGSAPVDRAHLARYTFGNTELEIEVLNLFALQAPLYLAALRDARNAKDWRDAAHTLKGSARAVGAVRVAERAVCAEALLPSIDAEARARAIDDLAEALAEAKAYIAGLEGKG